MFDIEIKEGLLKQKLKALKDDHRASVSLDQKLISFQLLSELYEQYWKYETDCSMKTLLKSGSLRFKRRKQPGEKYSESFKAELEQLRFVQQEKEYQAMLKRSSLHGTANGTDHEPSIAEINKEIKEQVSAVANVLLTVFGTVYAVWYVTKNVWEAHLRVMLCLFSGLLVLAADVAMYNMYYRKIEEARTTERRKKVVKRVVKRLI